MTERASDTGPEPYHTRTDTIADLIDWHHGDTRAAIAMLLDDIQALREQLTIATAAISPGYTRGWMPDETADNAAR